MAAQQPPAPRGPSHRARPSARVEKREQVVIRIAGDSGDGMQLAGDRFTAEAAAFGNDLATQPNFPAEIRAPQGTLPGVSSFQIQIAEYDILTAGDRPDVLVAMNPAALRTNIGDLRPGGILLVNSDEFGRRHLTKAGYGEDPLRTAEFEQYQVHEVAMTTLTAGAVEPAGVGKKDVARSKNMFALGLLCWLYGRELALAERFLAEKFAAEPDLAEANTLALKAGWNYGETTESFAVSYRVAPAALPKGTYRQITGSTALAYGLLAAGELSGMEVFFGSYPITPASDILHELSRNRQHGVVTFQAEDEIAAVGAAIGASWGGALGVTSTSGPGLALKSEGIGLAVMAELPLVVVCVQRGGPSTGLPTKTEQADLLQALFGRNGESPVPVVAPQSPGDCFAAAVEAARTAVTYRTPVLLLSDGSLANGAEPWMVPRLAELPRIQPDFATAPPSEGVAHQPYARDPHTLAREWALPGTPGLEHRIGGLEKSDGTGNISYDPANHERMTRLRRAKVDGVRVPELAVDDPDTARVLVLGWGSTYGPIGEAVRRLRAEGHRVARAHLRHLNPFPENLDEMLRRYERVVVPEMNLGQLSLLLRGSHEVDVRPVTKVAGTAFLTEELADAVREELTAKEPTARERDKAAGAVAAAVTR
ncbi:2-oxoacid:acceptor oxidoreductase subunit alpha [Streptomyces sulphureus]|uniref:2-oxoacid:acceptor oxidoreductase subunit alpha n=1 Tax=Streptomyces sulphureus TaxID=47758 RepID=UPI000368C11C|nr:2-oxoacid:acceptor oxidoreductase subunit alpha [Streptomyces sulphureus]